MLTFLVVVLIILWLLGFIDIPALQVVNIDLFTIFSRTISILDLLVFLLVVWIIGVLPSPFRQIAAVIFILWLLAFFGLLSFIAIAGLSNILMLILIVGLILYILKVF